MQAIFEEVARIIDSGLNSVINNPSIVLLNIIALFVLALFVKKFFWSKITDYLNRQQDNLQMALNEAEEQKRSAKKIQDKAQHEYKMMRKETEELKNMLTKNAKKDAEKVLLEANLVAEKKLNLAEKQIELEYKKVESEIKESIKDLAFTAAKKIIKKEIDEKTHKRIIEETLDEGIKNQFK